MLLRPNETFDRLVDHFISEALKLVPNEVQREIVIMAFALRDGVYRSAQDIGDALGISPVEVMLLLEQALQTIMKAQFDGQLSVGGTG